MALLTAPLLAAAQSPIAFAPLALVALAPWLCIARRSGGVEALLTGALVGTATGCLVALWMPEALRSLGSSHSTAVLGWVVTAAWAKLPFFAGIGGLVWALRARPAWLQIVSLAAAFGACDWIAGRWSLGVPWGLVGQSQGAVPGVAQLAAVGGVPLLSAWVAAINCAIVLAFLRVPTARPAAAALVASWGITAVLGIPVAVAVRPPPSPDGDITLLLVQPDLPRGLRWDASAQPEILERVAAFTDGALAETDRDVDAIVWPENLLTSPLDRNESLRSELQRWVDRWGVPVIGGFVQSPRSGRPRRYRSSVLWMAPQQGVIAGVDKTRAIPVLESSADFAGPSRMAPLFGRASRWPKVEEAKLSRPLRGPFTVTPALCYEVLFPAIVAERRPPDSRVLLNLADDSWVSGDRATRQLADFAAFRAIEQRLPLIRLAHGGLSRVVDAYGRVVLALPRSRWAQAQVTVGPRSPPTLPERLALLGLPIAAGGGVGWILARRVRRRANRPEIAGTGISEKQAKEARP